MKTFEISFENENVEPAFAVGERYETQATNGAGLICDVYENRGDASPTATFARVVAVRVVEQPWSPSESDVAVNFAKSQAAWTEFRAQAAKNSARAARAREEQP